MALDAITEGVVLVDCPVVDAVTLAALARLEVSSFFGELLPRLEIIEQTGPAEPMATTFVGGLKHLPIRVELK